MEMHAQDLKNPPAFKLSARKSNPSNSTQLA